MCLGDPLLGGGDALEHGGEGLRPLLVSGVERRHGESGSLDEALDGSVEVAAAEEASLDRRETVLPAGDLVVGCPGVLDEAQRAPGPKDAPDLAEIGRAHV